MAQLAASNQNTILKIREFRGLNENPDGDTHIKTGELSECRNFKITRDRHLQLRPGQKTTLNLRTAWDALETKPESVEEPELSGAWSGTLNGERHTLVSFGGVLWDVDPSGGEPVKKGTCTQDSASFFGFGGKVYLLNGHEYLSWTGKDDDSFQAVEGYVPTIRTASPPAGGGELLENVNRLTGKRKIKFSPDGSATSFLLEKEVDEVVSVEGTAITYSLNKSTGVVTFSSAPPKGTNTVIIKLFAMSMISLMTLAYPKVVYDRTKVSKWSSRVGAAIGVNGNVDGVAKIIDPASISPQIAQFIDLAVGYTQKFLGASDVALGDTRPDNTSAIIALQRAAATPMELTKQALLQSIEDLGRIFMDFMGAYYGERFVEVPVPQQDPMMGMQEGAPRTVIVPFDFSALQGIPCSVELDVGASSYWSEIASMQTLDNLLMNNRISTVEYLKRLPAGQITDRETLIAILERKEALEQQMAGMLPAAGGLAGDAAGGALTDSVPSPEGSAGGGYGTLQRKINETGEIPKER